MSKPRAKVNGDGSGTLSRDEAARLIARGDQVGYKIVKVGRRERLEPVNFELQMMFESALAQFRQQ